MKIKLIRNEDCHVWQKAETELKNALKSAGLPEEYELVVVQKDEETIKYRFFGSPQITIDGVDIDPMAKKATQFQVQGCRFYIWKGKMLEYPPAAMILQALES